MSTMSEIVERADESLIDCYDKSSILRGGGFGFKGISPSNTT